MIVVVECVSRGFRISRLVGVGDLELVDWIRGLK